MSSLAPTRITTIVTKMRRGELREACRLLNDGFGEMNPGERYRFLEEIHEARDETGDTFPVVLFDPKEDEDAWAHDYDEIDKVDLVWALRGKGFRFLPLQNSPRHCAAEIASRQLRDFRYSGPADAPHLMVAKEPGTGFELMPTNSDLLWLLFRDGNILLAPVESLWVMADDESDYDSTPEGTRLINFRLATPPHPWGARSFKGYFETCVHNDAHSRVTLTIRKDGSIGE